MMNDAEFTGRLSGIRVDALTRIAAVLVDDMRDDAAKVIRCQEIVDTARDHVAALTLEAGRL